MKLKSLLLTAAAVALTTGQASALDLENFQAPTGSILSEDLDFATTAVGGIFPFDLTLTNGGEFPADDNLFITVRLPSGLDFPATANATDFITDLDVNSVSLFDRSVVNGQNQVQLLVSLDETVDITDINFTLPVEVNACPGSEGIFITAQVSDANGIFLENDTNGAAITDPNFSSFLSCGDSKDGAVTSGEDDIVILLEDYVELGTIDGTPGTSAVVGTVDYDLNDVVIDLEASPTPITPSDIDTIEFDVVVTYPVGIVDISVGNVSCDQGGTAATANVFSCVFSGADLDLLLTGDPEDVTVTVDGTTVLPGPNMIDIVDAVCNFSDVNATFIASTDGEDGMLDTLQREGQVFGFFDWNAEAGPVNSVYRVTGLSTTENTPLTVVYENSNTGQDLSVEHEIDAADVLDGEYIIASRLLLATLNPGYGRADVQFNFQTTNALDVDRLISSNGIVTDFGDNANAASAIGTVPGDPFPVSDGDNGAGGTNVTE